MVCPMVDCSNKSHVPQVPLEPNDDIAGPGVIIGFVGNAYFALLLLFVYYLVAYDPLQCPFSHGPAGFQSGADWWKPSSVDIWVLTLVRTRTRRLLEKLRLQVFLLYNAKLLELRFVSSIIHMCDLQLLTGLAILISAYISIPCGTTAYHWQIIVYLAWFSSIIHLSGLVAVRHYLYSRPWERLARILAALVFLVMLLVAMVPTGYFDWDIEAMDPVTSMNSSVACFFDPSYGPEVAKQTDIGRCMRYNTINSEAPLAEDDLEAWCAENGVMGVRGSAALQSMIFSVVLLAWGFLSRIVRLWKPLNRFIALSIRRPITEMLQRWITSLEGRTLTSGGQSGMMHLREENEKGARYFLINRPLVAWLVFVRLNIDCMTSMFGEIYWLLVLLLWGTFRLNSTLNHAQTASDDLEGETNWNFGQTLPVLLLVGPFLMVFRSFTSTNNPNYQGCLHYQQWVREHGRHAEPQDGSSDGDDGTIHNDKDGNNSDMTPTRVDSDQSDCPLTLRNNPFSDLKTRRTNEMEVARHNRYLTNPWLGSCLVAVFISFCFMAGVNFWALINFQGGMKGNDVSITALWFDTLQLVTYLLLYYPLAMHMSIVLGLAHDELCQTCQTRRDGTAMISGQQQAYFRGGGCKYSSLLALPVILLTFVYLALYILLSFNLIPGSIPFMRASQWFYAVAALGLSVLLYGIYASLILCVRRRRRRMMG